MTPAIRRIVVTLTVAALVAASPAAFGQTPKGQTFSIGGAFAPKDPSATKAPSTIPGLFIVKTHGAETVTTLGKKLGISAAGIQKGKNGTARVRTPKGKSDAQFQKELEANPEVVYACPVYVRSVQTYSVPPNDLYYARRKGFDYWDGPYAYGCSWWLRTKGLNAAALWKLADDPVRGVKAPADSFPIAVIDTGFYLSHPDRGANIVGKKDEFATYTESTGILTTDYDVTPVSAARAEGGVGEVSHGTFVAGMIGAATNNGQGVAGIGYGAPVWIYKAQGLYINDEYPEGLALIADVALINGIYDATDDGARVISISIGGPTYSAALQDAIDYAYAKGVLVFAASGNEGVADKVYYPAANNHVIGVGAYGLGNGWERIVAPFTNTGIGADKTQAGANNGQLDLLAPGVLIWGMVNPGWDADGVGENAFPGYAFADGTSMATPAAAGLAALLWRFGPALTVDQLAFCLTDTSANWFSDYPHRDSKCVNALGAYSRLQTMIRDTTAPPAPTVGGSSSDATSIRYSWLPVDDLSMVRKYSVYTDSGVLLSEVTSAAYTITGLTAGTTRSCYVTATDWMGNESAPSNVATVTSKTPPPPPPPADTTPPTAPTGLTAIAITHTRVALSWAAATDDRAVTLYHIYDAATGLEVGWPSGTRFVVQNLLPGETYDFYVTAQDYAGNPSARSETLTVTTYATPDVTPPTVPANAQATPGVQEMVVAWDPSSDDRSGVNYYSVVVHDHHDGDEWSREAYNGDTSIVIGDLEPNHSYGFEVTAVDYSGNRSGPGAYKTEETLPDPTPPSTPPRIEARPGGYPGEAYLEWLPSKDMDPIDKYIVYDAAGVKVGEIQRRWEYDYQETINYYTVKDLQPDTTYGFYVVAVNTSEFASAPSETVWVAMPEAPIVLSPVYRFYNFTNGTHFYTNSETERDMVVARWPNVFRLEGPVYSTYAPANTQPLYRFYNRVSGSHFYTASPDEAAAVLAKWSNVFTLDGQTYSVCPSPVLDGVAVYRFYNKKNGSHFFTASAGERDTVIATWPDVYSYEGPAFWLAQ